VERLNENSARKLARRLIAAIVVASLMAVVGLFAVHRAIRQVPEFYRQALTASPATQHDEGQRFEEHALAMHNQLQQAGQWEARFTQDEVNGWLAAELPAKFPRALPPGVSDPRVAIARGKVRLAAHYQRGGVDTIVSLAGEAHLTQQPNEVAIHISQVRAGLLPVPLGKFLQEVTERATRANLPLRWTEAEGTPVALIRVPRQWGESRHRQLVLQRLVFGDGELAVAGRIEPQSKEADDAAPATAVQPAEAETIQR
jgi:hypothetical protein